MAEDRVLNKIMCCNCATKYYEVPPVVEVILATCQECGGHHKACVTVTEGTKWPLKNPT